MNSTNNKEKLDQIVSRVPSQWEEKARWRKANRVWLKKSALIAIKILATLRERKMSQKSLAELMSTSPQYINRLLSGRENLTLETISKIEVLLNTELISINYSSIRTEVSASKPIIPNTKFVSSKTAIQSKPLSLFFENFFDRTIIPAA